MSVRIARGNRESVVPELWTNINHNVNPSDFEAYPMQFVSQNGDTAIYKASGNPYLEDVLVCQDAHATRIWCLFLDRLSNVAEHVVEHVALLRAIIDGDEDLAAKLASEHVIGFEQAVRAVL